MIKIILRIRKLKICIGSDAVTALPWLETPAQASVPLYMTRKTTHFFSS
jgi:hypothetical protein